MDTKKVAALLAAVEKGSLTSAARELEYTQSAHVIGRVIRNDVSWGVVFLNENGDIIENLDLTR